MDAARGRPCRRAVRVVLLAAVSLLLAPAASQAVGELSYSGGTLSINAEGRVETFSFDPPPPPNAFRMNENDGALTLVGSPPCTNGTWAGGGFTECRVDDASQPVSAVDLDFGDGNDQAVVGTGVAKTLAWDFDLGAGNDLAVFAFDVAAKVSGGPGNDTAQPNNLGGRDAISLGAGDFDRVNYSQLPSGVDVVLGGSAPDDITGAEGVTGTNFNDRLVGDGGANQLAAEGGADEVVGGPGQDFINAGPGDDDIDALDGEIDRVFCGGGADVLSADSIDVVENDCPTGPPPPPSDRDGDALRDSWEENGVDVDGDGTIDLDLPAMGADPDHKDIFVELDFMAGHAIGQAQIDAVTQAFLAAPVPNPDGLSGVTLHVDNGPSSVMDPVTSQTWGVLSDQDSLTHQDVLGSDFVVSGVTHYDWSEFQSIRLTKFAVARHPVFHYAIAAHSGPAQDWSGLAYRPGADFIIADHENCAPPPPLLIECAPDPEYLAATFMHELGHNLGLRHGGTDGAEKKPNYLSIMNYNFGYGLVLADGSHELDYSRFDLSLDETALDEQRGFGIDIGPLTAYSTIYRCQTDGSKKTVDLLTSAIDWSCNGTIFPSLVAADVDGDGAMTNLSGPVDWDRLVYSGGGIGSPNQPPAPASTVIDEPTPAELLENQQLLEAGPTPVPGPAVPGPGPAVPGPGPAVPGPAIDTDAPETTITKDPPKKLTKTKAKLKFSSDEATATFECRLAGKRANKNLKQFAPCSSPLSYRNLKLGKFKFEVRAIDPAGNVDPTPAKKKFKRIQ